MTESDKKEIMGAIKHNGVLIEIVARNLREFQKETEQRFADVDRRFDEMIQKTTERFDGMEHRIDIAEFRNSRLDERLSDDVQLLKAKVGLSSN